MTTIAQRRSVTRLRNRLQPLWFIAGAALLAGLGVFMVLTVAWAAGRYGAVMAGLAS